MSIALSMEELNEVNTVNVKNVRVEYFRKVLNKQFVDLFLRVNNNDVRLLQEFVYGIDCLVDISRSPSFPSGRLINTPDVNPRIASILGQAARITKDYSLFGCQVSSATSELVEEFFEYNYLKVFSDLLQKVKLPFCYFELDGVAFNFNFVHSVCAIREISAFRFSNVNDGVEVCIPFNKSRITG